MGDDPQLPPPPEPGPYMIETSVFGCIGTMCVSGNTQGAEFQGGMPGLGGGLQFCVKPINQCNASADDRIGTVGVTAGPGGIGITVFEDGVKCISIGPHVQIPGPVIAGGDATVHK